MKADCQDRDNEDAFNTQAEWLIGQLIDHCEKYVFQLECSPTTGYYHYQGYFELHNKQRFEWVQSHIGPFEFLQERKGNPVQAWKYCCKQETQVYGPWMYGEPTLAERGNNKASELFVKDVKSGMSDEMLSEAHPSMYLQRIRGMDRLRQIMKPVRKEPLEVYLFYGPPGVGKTEFAYEQARLAGQEPYELPIGKDFWTSVTIHQKQWVIIDEFKSNLALKDLLKLLDNRVIEVPMKGGFNWWCPDVVIITTNVSPWNWYQYKERDFERQALFRRLKTGGCYKFEKNDDRVPRPIEIDIEDQSAFGPVEQQTFGRTTPKYKSAMETYFELKLKRMQATPMMGLVQTPAKKMQQVDAQGYYATVPYIPRIVIDDEPTQMDLSI